MQATPHQAQLLKNYWDARITWSELLDAWEYPRADHEGYPADASLKDATEPASGNTELDGAR
jgi:hypothetical protein